MSKPHELHLHSQTKKGQTDIFVQTDLFFFPSRETKQNNGKLCASEELRLRLVSFHKAGGQGRTWLWSSPPRVPFWGLLLVLICIHSFTGGIQLSCLGTQLSSSPTEVQEKRGPALRKSLLCPRASLKCFPRWHF